MTKAVYPGAFDPITNGQVDIATRAARLFEELVIGVYARPAKNELFPLEERLELVRLAFEAHDNISVVQYDGLTVELVRSVGAQTIVRGLRVVSDFEHEFQMALMSRRLAPDIDFVCLMTSVEHTFLSSGIVKEVALLGGDVSEFVPPPVKRALDERLAMSGKDITDTVEVVSLKNG